MNTTARLRVIPAIAIGTLTIGCVILFLGTRLSLLGDAKPNPASIIADGVSASTIAAMITDELAHGQIG